MWWEHWAGIFWKRHNETQGAISCLVKGRLQLLLLDEKSTFSLCLHWLRQSWSFMAIWISLITQVKINCVPHQPQFLNSYYSWCEGTAINVQTGWNNWWLHFGSRQSWNNTSVMKYQISSIRYDFSATYVFFTVGPIFIGTAEKTNLPFPS